MRTVFADSFYFFALVNKGDPAHGRAVAFLQSYRGRMVTTGRVLTEIGDGLARGDNRASFLQTVDTLRGEPNVSVEACGDELLEQGIDLYRQRPDKEWSLTDCISFVVMQREGITEALTGDHHFEQAGFAALLK
jgi:predicted nucleic acid-binding protein